MPALPSDEAGVFAVMVVVEATTTSVAATAPKVTSAPDTKPVPVMVTVVPPAIGPEFGETPVTEGACALRETQVPEPSPALCIQDAFAHVRSEEALSDPPFTFCPLASRVASVVHVEPWSELRDTPMDVDRLHNATSDCPDGDICIACPPACAPTGLMNGVSAAQLVPPLLLMRTAGRVFAPSLLFTAATTRLPSADICRLHGLPLAVICVMSGALSHVAPPSSDRFAATPFDDVFHIATTREPSDEQSRKTRSNPSEALLLMRSPAPGTTHVCPPLADRAIWTESGFCV